MDRDAELFDEGADAGIEVNGVHLDNEERTPCEIWTRVMGYLRPYSSYNDGKRSEFLDRRYFKIYPS